MSAVWLGDRPRAHPARGRASEGDYTATRKRFLLFTAGIGVPRACTTDCFLTMAVRRHQRGAEATSEARNDAKIAAHPRSSSAANSAGFRMSQHPGLPTDYPASPPRERRSMAETAGSRRSKRLRSRQRTGDGEPRLARERVQRGCRVSGGGTGLLGQPRPAGWIRACDVSARASRRSTGHDAQTAPPSCGGAV